MLSEALEMRVVSFVSLLSGSAQVSSRFPIHDQADAKMPDGERVGSNRSALCAHAAPHSALRL